MLRSNCRRTTSTSSNISACLVDMICLRYGLSACTLRISYRVRIFRYARSPFHCLAPWNFTNGSPSKSILNSEWNADENRITTSACYPISSSMASAVMGSFKVCPHLTQPSTLGWPSIRKWAINLGAHAAYLPAGVSRRRHWLRPASSCP